MSHAGQRGSVTLLAVAVAGLLMFLTLALGATVGLVRAHRAAQSAADLAALAGAQQLAVGADACDVAADVAGANGARLVGCQPDGSALVVEVAVPGPRWRVFGGELSASSRAGPVVGE